MAKNVLIFFNQADEQWKNRLKSQIDVLIKSGGFDIDAHYWSEKNIDPGIDWHSDLESVINQADLIILMVSDLFLGSPIFQSDKVKEHLKRKQKGGFPIFAVQVYKSGWRRYSWMKNLPVWPGGGQYLSDLSDSAVDGTLSDVADQVALKFNLKPEITEGILAFLGLKWVGPVKDLSFEPGRRLSVITGNNGYGKTFLLENVWWALAGKWPGYKTLPGKGAKKGDANISFQLTAVSGNKGEIESISYNEKKEDWSKTGESKATSGLVVYARVDGSFAVWDPVRGQISTAESPLIFEHRDSVFNGITDSITPSLKLCNGLLTDWVDWQKTPDSPFNILEKVLETFSCGKQEMLVPGSPKRIYGTQLFPSIVYPYGEVPIIHTAASVQRISSLAYLLLFVWNEHKRACEGKRETYKNMVVLIDEIECHLHPQWQRSIIPSLLEVQKHLDSELEIQFIVTTHSPLALASLEPVFDKENDKLFHLELETDEILLKEYPHERLGRVDHWFTSEVIGLSQPRSLEAEEAIDAAHKVQLEDSPSKEEVREVHKRLLEYLGDFDTFWPHWIYFAEKVLGERL
jgi:hypothetical protein